MFLCQYKVFTKQYLITVLKMFMFKLFLLCEVIRMYSEETGDLCTCL